jgi:protein-tyrosine phosphatase
VNPLLPTVDALPALWPRQAEPGFADPEEPAFGIVVAVQRDLDWDGCVNVRDLGGLAAAGGGAIVSRAIVRADNVRRLTEKGWMEARNYGIRTILDLRSDGERADDSAAPPNFDVIAVSLFDDFDSDPAYRAELERRLAGCDVREAYRVLYTEALRRNRRLFATAVEVIANARPGGVLIHCAAGKDRTGLLAALLLRLAGVPISTVADDYEHSERRLGTADSAPAGVIDKVIETVETEHGSVEAFFLDAGATPVDVERVRQRLRRP